MHKFQRGRGAGAARLTHQLKLERQKAFGT